MLIVKIMILSVLLMVGFDYVVKAYVKNTPRKLLRPKHGEYPWYMYVSGIWTVINFILIVASVVYFLFLR